MSTFLFPFENDANGGPLDDFFYFLAASNDKIKQAYLLAISYFSLPLDKKYQIYNNLVESTVSPIPT